MCSMNIFNKINSISKDYTKIENLFLPTNQKKPLFLNCVMQFQKTEIERNAIQSVLSLLDNDVQDSYEQLISSLSQNTLATTAQPSNNPAAITYDPPSLNPLYNASKQAWAHNVLEDFLAVVNKAVEAVFSQLPTSPTTTDPATAFQTLKDLAALLTKLVNKAKNGELSTEDFDKFYLLPDEIFAAIQAFPFEGNQKVLFSNQLLAALGEDASIEQVFADIRIEGLQDILNIVQTKLSPEEFASFQELQSLIDSLREYVDPFQAEGFNTILQTSEALAEAIIKTSLPSNEKIELCRNIADLYRDQVLSIKNLDNVLNETIFINARMQSLFTDICSLVEFIMGSFAPIGLNETTIEVTNASIAGSLQAIRAIDARFHELTAEQQTLVNETVKKLNEFKGGDYIGAVWAYFTAATVISSNDSVSMDDVKQALTAQANTVVSSFELAKTLQASMKSIVAANCRFITNVDGVDRDYTICSVDNNSNKVVLNPVLLNFGSRGFLPNITLAANNHAETSARAFFRFRALTQVESAKLESTLQGSEHFLQRITQLRKDLLSYQLLAQSYEIRSLPLPSAVAAVLIDRYMPKEIDYLTQMKADLYYSNLGSSVGNAMIDAISQFVNGATYFNFASFAGQQPMTAMATDTFPGSMETAKAKLALEKQQSKLYLEYANKALEEVKTQLARVQNDTVITNEQRLRITDALQGYADNLNAISGSLVLLQIYLNPLRVGVRDGNQGGGDTGKDPEGTFHVFGGQDQWQARLETLEDALVSGLPSNIISGGLFPVQASVQADQQAFADMGQSYQLEMQMHMTAMQQEWTVVATSLQILNQIYLGLTRKLAG
ncbi:CT620/CT621 family type III secretion system effector [Chlamydia suis]|uniref:CT620/CT621 family type III secretion system effector n=1 Tax=Chlamydia suis TaxID=83559 RepID=UPI0009AFC77B|nr:CT620/CT621 family type III secretion system effector [Chlamydia suis]